MIYGPNFMLHLALKARPRVLACFFFTVFGSGSMVPKAQNQGTLQEPIASVVLWGSEGWSVPRNYVYEGLVNLVPS